MNYKIIRRLGLTEKYYKYKLKTKKEDIVSINPNDARACLKSVYSNSNSTCIRKKEANNHQEYDLDIIVPVYNGEKFIGEMIESFLNQDTKYSIRLIVVNDGSTDNTQDILNEYSEKKNIFVISKENEGTSKARNAGLQTANSKYLMFLDADDKLADKSLDAFLNKAYEIDADIIEGGYDMISENGKKTEYRFRHQDENQVSSEKLYGYPWGKLYKTKLWENVEFPNYFFEDSVCRTIIYPQAKNICLTSLCIYKYRENKKSITHSLHKSKGCIDVYWITEVLLRDRKALGIEIDEEYCRYFLKFVPLAYRRTSHLYINTRKNIFVTFCDLYERYLKPYFEKYKIENDLLKAFEKRDYEWYRIYSESHFNK